MATESLDKKIGVSIMDMKRFSLWGASILLVGAVGFAHGTLWSHEMAIAVIKNKQENRDVEIREVKEILKEILKEMRNK